jgi:hypothetical protein
VLSHWPPRRRHDTGRRSAGVNAGPTPRASCRGQAARSRPDSRPQPPHQGLPACRAVSATPVAAPGRGLPAIGLVGLPVGHAGGFLEGARARRRTGGVGASAGFISSADFFVRSHGPKRRLPNSRPERSPGPPGSLSPRRASSQSRDGPELDARHCVSGVSWRDAAACVGSGFDAASRRTSNEFDAGPVRTASGGRVDVFCRVGFDTCVQNPKFGLDLPRLQVTHGREKKLMSRWYNCPSLRGISLDQKQRARRKFYMNAHIR